MKNLEIEYILLAFLGVLIHILINVLNRKNKNIPFSFSYFVTDVDNWIRMILSVLSILSLLLMSDSLSEIFGVTLSDGSPAKDVFAFITGYLNHSLIRNVLKIFKK
jgi:lipopolysaccharide export LptBFGC system permease protein LptF